MNSHIRGWSISGIAMLSFAAGLLINSQILQPTVARADSSRVFELMVYHAKPGKAADLESIFRDVSTLQAKHNLSVVGYWVPNEDSAWKDTFVYLIAHPSLEEAKKNWDRLHTDPDFLPYRKAAAPLIEQVNGGYRVEEVYMRPTDYSAMK
jgi:NIPSNAP